MSLPPWDAPAPSPRAAPCAPVPLAWIDHGVAPMLAVAVKCGPRNPIESLGLRSGACAGCAAMLATGHCL